jgi:hypothetical protein
MRRPVCRGLRHYTRMKAHCSSVSS